ncbi:MAG: hypothetical protein JW849_01935 [Phycisphaerae bacterium]|nr:hypothetical protein [Phycisphaerae bacterium]
MRRIVLGVILALGALAGCENLSYQREVDAEKQRDAALAHADELAKQVVELSAEVETRKKQIETLQNLGEKRMENVFTVASIEIGRHSGGIDVDKEPGQDAVRVFLRPLDKDGHVLKAAGDVKIQLFDLAQPEDKTLFAEYTYSVKDIGKYWAGGLLANQYSFQCPFPDDSPPEHPEINLRVTFTDYLTGRSFTSQKLLKISLPPKETPTPQTKPAE